MWNIKKEGIFEEDPIFNEKPSEGEHMICDVDGVIEASMKELVN